MKAAATARGDFTGTATSEQGIRYFVLPADVGGLAGDVTCFAGQPNKTAACAPALGSLPDTPIRVESGVAAYNPVYYALVGWPSLFLDGGAMVIAMRLVNAIIVSALWSIVMVTLGFTRPRTVFFIGLAITPLALYLGGVVNPSGAEIAATAAVLVLVDTVVARPGKRIAPIIVVLGIVVALLLNLRSISPLFAALAVLAVLALRGAPAFWLALRNRAVEVMLLALIPVVIFAVGWTILVSQPAGFIPSSDPIRPGRREAFFHTLDQFSSQFTEMTGVMGWFDAWPPPGVHIAWAALVGGAVLITVLVARRRDMLTMLGYGALLLIVPALFQAASATQYGYIWQGRYGLPLLALLLLVVGLSVEAAGRAPGAIARYAALSTALVGLQIWVFVTVLKRFAIGAGADWSLWTSESAWRPPGGSFLVCAVFVAGAALMTLAILTNCKMRGAGDVPPHVAPAAVGPAVA